MLVYNIISLTKNDESTVIVTRFHTNKILSISEFLSDSNKVSQNVISGWKKELLVGRFIVYREYKWLKKIHRNGGWNVTFCLKHIMVINAL